MPPKARKGKRKLAKNAVALAKAALENSHDDEQTQSELLQPSEIHEKIAQMEEEMKQKGENAPLHPLGPNHASNVVRTRWWS